ncbi:MAG: transposase [Cyclobacteriaceae bacterium]|nr:MAG: transposase [Cyclobacteriaceae bacterium]
MGLRGRSKYSEADCFFVTTTCYKWYFLLADDSSKQIICESIDFLNSKYRTHLLGFVIMPNHLHLILFFPKGNFLSDWMRDLKKFTSVKIRQKIEQSGNINLLESLRVPERKQVFKVWEDRFDDVIVSNSKILNVKLDYIHMNPLQEHWNLVLSPEDYVYSSARFYEYGNQPSCTVTHFREFF